MNRTTKNQVTKRKRGIEGNRHLPADRAPKENDSTEQGSILASILDTQDEMICRFLPDTSLTYSNKAYRDAIGITDFQTEGINILSLLPSDSREDFLNCVKSLNWENPSAVYTYHSQAGPKPNHWQEWTLKAVFDADHQVREIQSVGRDITAYKVAEGAQEVHGSFQAMVAEIARSYVGSDIDCIDATINDMLQAVGKHFSADRAYLFRYDQDLSRMSNTHEWCGNGIPSQLQRMQNTSCAAYTWWQKKMQKGEVIHIPDVNKLPISAKNELKEFKAQNIKSLIALPLKSKGRIMGFFGFDSVKDSTSWDSIQIDYLKIIADLTADQLHKNEIEQDLQNQNQLYAILSRIAQHYINLPSEQLSDSINASLAELATFVNADRAYIFDYDWDRQTCSNTYEWCAEEISPQIEELQDVPVDMIKWWTMKHKQGEALYIENVLALPEDDGVRMILEPQDVKSLITLPIMNGKDCLGFVGFDSVRRFHSYSLKEQSLLSFYAQLIINVKNRIALEDELRKEKQNAEKANKAKSEFLANMSHEIRTPLNGVIGFSELILKTNLDKAQTQYAQNIIGSGYTLLGVINDILDFSKIESGKLELDVTTTDLLELVEHATDIIKIQSAQKGLEFLLNVAPGIPRNVQTDPLRLKQILVNLLSNAVKFTHSGEIELKLEWSKVDQHEGVFTFVVRDTGIGIDPEQKDYLFKAFSQADSSTSRKYGGTGLGLVIANTLAQLMDSRIEFKSELNGGSEFYFKLLLPYEQRDEESESENLKGIKRALIIDDSVNNRTILRDTLAFWGIESNLCDSGIEALKMWSSGECFDVVLVDYNMPHLNGLDTIRMLLNQKGVSSDDPPAILLHSSSDDINVLTESRKMGIEHVLIKPVKINEIYKCLSRISKAKLSNNKHIEEELIQDRRKPEFARPAKILIAEDNDMNLTLLHELLTMLAPEVQIYSVINGKEALKALDTYQPDLIFMDVQMPEMDGVSATRVIRANPNKLLAETPIVAITAGALNHERTRCLEAGMNDFLTKPVLAKDLAEALKKYLLEYTPKAPPADLSIISTHSSKHFDHHKLLANLSKDIEVFRRILTVTKRSFPQKINKLNAAIEEDNREDVKHLAHSIKGSAMNLYFAELMTIAKDLEAQAINMSKIELNGAFLKLKEEWNIVLDLIKKMT